MDRRSQDTVERALSDLIVTVACDDEDADIEVKNIADVLKLYRKHRTGKPRQPRRRNVRVTPIDTKAWAADMTISEPNNGGAGETERQRAAVASDSHDEPTPGPASQQGTPASPLDDADLSR